MNYTSAMDYIHSTQKFGSRLGLDNVGVLLSLMGNPQNNLKFVHVAGTNGKGSTSSFISSVLTEGSYKTGLFTSPSLHSYNERIRINDNNISDDDMAKHTEIVKSKIDEMVALGHNHPTEFEIMTAIGLSYFSEQKCDIVVLEVGLGGKYDATNIIPSPLLAVITQISFDHTEYLGNTLTEIAGNKAGIIKENCKVVMYPQDEETQNVIKSKCLETNSKLYTMNFDNIIVKSTGLDGQVFDFGNFKNIKIGLIGTYQTFNAVVALNALLILRKNGFDFSDEVLYNGLAKTKWAGRLEILQRNPVMIIDGAHNLNGVFALASSLKLLFGDKKIIFITGILADKEYIKMIECIAPLAKRFITITPDSPRALSAEQLAEHIKKYHNDVIVKDTVIDALKTAIDEAKADDVICAFGSLYYLADVRSYFNLDENL